MWLASVYLTADQPCNVQSYLMSRVCLDQQCFNGILYKKSVRHFCIYTGCPHGPHPPWVSNNQELSSYVIFLSFGLWRFISPHLSLFYPPPPDRTDPLESQISSQTAVSAGSPVVDDEQHLSVQTSQSGSGLRSRDLVIHSERRKGSGRNVSHVMDGRVVLMHNTP